MAKKLRCRICKAEQGKPHTGRCRYRNDSTPDSAVYIATSSSSWSDSGSSSCGDTSSSSGGSDCS